MLNAHQMRLARITQTWQRQRQSLVGGRNLVRCTVGLCRTTIHTLPAGTHCAPLLGRPQSLGSCSQLQTHGQPLGKGQGVGGGYKQTGGGAWKAGGEGGLVVARGGWGRRPGEGGALGGR